MRKNALRSFAILTLVALRAAGQQAQPAAPAAPAASQGSQTLPPGSQQQQQLQPGQLGTNAGLLPTGNGTNRVYPANSYLSTNRFGADFRDEAYTVGDQRLLIQIRQVIQPVFMTNGVNLGATPVRFQCREGVVTMVGLVSDEEHKRRCETLVREVPGVVQVVDQLQVGTADNSQLGSAPVVPSAQLAGTDQAFTPNDQRLLIQLKQEVQPIIGNSDPWVPVHFVCRDGVVTLVGIVPNDLQKQQIFEVVQRTPGVVQVVNQIQVNVNAQTAGGASTSLSATGLTNGIDRAYSDSGDLNTNSPAGLRKRQDLPPGLQSQGNLSPGLEKLPDTNQ